MMSEYILQDVNGNFAKISLNRLPLLVLYDCQFVMKDGIPIKGKPFERIPPDIDTARKIIGISKDLITEWSKIFPDGYPSHVIGFFTQSGFCTIPKNRMDRYVFGRVKNRKLER